MSASGVGEIRDLLAVYNRRYASLLIPIVLMMAALAGITYVENSLISTLSRAFAHPDQHRGIVGKIAVWLAVGLPLVAVVLFGVVRLVRAGLAYLQEMTEGRLRVRSIDDLEQTVLRNLLRKDDEFFTEHPPAEIMGRLSKDVRRARSRRKHAISIFEASMLIIGHLYFFLERDWRFAVVAFGVCALGTFVTQRLLRPVKDVDAELMKHNDGVAGRFADFLQVVPEIQVGGLDESVSRKLGEAQVERQGFFMRLSRLQALLKSVDMATTLAAFVAMLLAIHYMQSGGSNDETVSLVPVVIMAIPKLFKQASNIVVGRMHLQIAATSVDRLVEYETDQASEAGGADRAPLDVGGEPIHLEQCTFRYAGPSGEPQGGVMDVDTVFTPGKWTAVVGQAGSGKSTLTQLVLGRLVPQNGEVRFGETNLQELSEAQRAEIYSLMPQRTALLDASIEENLLFGRRDASELSEEDLVLIEMAGVGQLCLVKALDQRATDGVLEGDIGELRRAARSFVSEEAGVEVRGYEDGAHDPTHWILELVLVGRADRRKVVERLGAASSKARLASLLDTELGRALVDGARHLLSESRQLLTLPTYRAYSKLASRRIEPEVWRMRQDALENLSANDSSVARRVELLRVALTAFFGELADPTSDEAQELLETVERGDGRDALRTLVSDGYEAFEIDALLTNLTWRENVLFGTTPTRNRRSAQAVERALVAFIRGRKSLARRLTRVGLGFEVGRLGGRLSGGQGQIIALCRALLRGTPVSVLDEPTSALDPGSRDRVATLLHEQKAGKILITISHDPELVREADEVKLLDAGRLVASGSFDDLLENEPLFKQILRV